MARGNPLDLLNPIRSDETSSLGERLEPALHGKSHAFEQASMDHIGEWMPINNAVKLRRESQSASDLSQTTEEDFCVRHLRAWGQVLRVTRIANDGAGRDPAQQKRRRRQARRADHDVGLCGELPGSGP